MMLVCANHGAAGGAARKSCREDGREDKVGDVEVKLTIPMDAMTAMEELINMVGINVFIWTARIACLSCVDQPEAVTMCHDLGASMLNPLTSPLQIAHHFGKFRQCIGTVDPSTFMAVVYYHSVFGHAPSNSQAHVMRLYPEVYTLDLCSEMVRCNQDSGRNSKRLLRIYMARLNERSALALVSLRRLMEMGAYGDVFRQLKATFPGLCKQLHMMEEWQRGLLGTPVAYLALYWMTFQIIGAPNRESARKFKRVTQRLQLIQPVFSQDYGSVFMAASLLQQPLSSSQKRARKL